MGKARPKLAQWLGHARRHVNMGLLIRRLTEESTPQL